MDVKSGLKKIGGENFVLTKRERDIIDKTKATTKETKAYENFLQNEFGGDWATGKEISKILKLSKNFLMEYDEEKIVKRRIKRSYMYNVRSLSVIIRCRLAEKKLEPLNSKKGGKDD